MPMTPFIGVRISWLMAATKSDLAWFAAVAWIKASRSSASACRCREMSRQAPA